MRLFGGCMSDFKGVKGPWVSEGYDIYSGDMDAHICIVSSFIDEETEDAHVNLIAAAPELLEALQVMVAARPATCNTVEISLARAAIAKALGQ